MNRKQQGFVQVPFELQVRPQPLWRRVWRWLQRAYELSEQRQQLARLDDAALKDLGLSRADVWQESQRPFWDDPQNR